MQSGGRVGDLRASDNRTTSETYPRFKDRKVLREGAGEPYKMEAEVRAMDPYASAEESTMQVLLMLKSRFTGTTVSTRRPSGRPVQARERSASEGAV